MLLIARQAVLLAGTALAAYTDARTGLIPDKITYPMMAIGIIFNAVEFNANLFVVPAAVFAIGFALYWLGKIGGGDVKLFTGIALLLPFLNQRVFIASALLAAALLSIVFYSVYYIGRYWRKGIDWKENKQCIARAVILGAITLAYFQYLVAVGLLGVEAAAVLYATVFFALVFLALERGIKRNFFLKRIALDKLEDDEVVASEFLEGSAKQKLGLLGKGIIGKKEIEKLKEAGVKTVPVYRDMPPFAPFVFLGVIIVLWKPELFGFLVI
jgi:hypothetical protein